MKLGAARHRRRGFFRLDIDGRRIAIFAVEPNQSPVLVGSIIDI
jgi:hypothetical protein